MADPQVDIPSLERIGADCWPAAHIEWLDGWRLGFTDGVTRRANSVLPLGWSGERALQDAIDDAETRYREHGLPTVFKLTEASLPTDLPAALDARRYGAEGASDVLARSVEGLAAGDKAGAEQSVRLRDAPTQDWCAISFADRSRDDAAVLAAMTRRIEAPAAFALVEIDGAPACAGFAVKAGQWAVIAGVHTFPAARRRGAARMLMNALARWSAEAGAPMLVLQVECDNTAAGALYRGLGFQRLYGYHYRVAQD